MINVYGIVVEFKYKTGVSSVKIYIFFNFKYFPIFILLGFFLVFFPINIVPPDKTLNIPICMNCIDYSWVIILI